MTNVVNVKTQVYLPNELVRFTKRRILKKVRRLAPEIRELGSHLYACLDGGYDGDPYVDAVERDMDRKIAQLERAVARYGNPV